LLENCVFYILRMYEFLHSQGHSRPRRSKLREHVCPLLPESGQIADRVGVSA
jgi:hypothetical protein